MKVKVSHSPNNRDFNQGVLHLWSKFGDSSYNGWGIIARTNSWLIHRHTKHTGTHRPMQAMTIPQGQPQMSHLFNLYLHIYRPYILVQRHQSNEMVRAIRGCEGLQSWQCGYCFWPPICLGLLRPQGKWKKPIKTTPTRFVWSMGYSFQRGKSYPIMT